VRQLVGDDTALGSRSIIKQAGVYAGSALCCPTSLVNSSTPLILGRGCHLWYGDGDDEMGGADLGRRVLRPRLDRGEVCVRYLGDGAEFKWTLQDPGLLGRLRTGTSHGSVVIPATPPDLFVVNGGLHAPMHPEFGARQAAWVRAVGGTLEASTPPLTRVVFVSSTHNDYGRAWVDERESYEIVRRAVAALAQEVGPKAQALTTYIPLHSLAGVDECGLAVNFPYRMYSKGITFRGATGVWDTFRMMFRSRADATCDQGWRAKDCHLGGGGCVTVVQQPAPKCLFRSWLSLLVWRCRSQLRTAAYNL
jgi:hypothetical protein